ncbi:MAG: DUF3987 domain-containing protein [Alphaproteobacteria bacterium]|nr:DUF3987 domain-containing protein [Alphaproteobacteria bacterium]
MKTPRKFKNFLEAYMNYTENTEPPYLYRFWSGISVIASALQRKCWLTWDRTIYPNFYIVLVGRSGVRKGTAMYPAQDLLRSIDIHMASEAVTREQLISELGKATHQGDDPKTGLPTLYSSLTIFSKEFTVFLGYNNNQLIMDLTDWFDCDDRWKYSTKTSGSVDIKGVWVNIIGATTPTQLQASLPLEAIGGGLSSRIIFVYEDRKGKIVDIPNGVNWLGEDDEEEVSNLDEKIKDDLVDDLMSIRQEIGEWVFDPSFRKPWKEWHKKNEAMTNFEGTFLEPYHTRRVTHIIKLCMIMCVNRDGGLVITPDDLEQADRILVKTEENMPNTFVGIGKNEDGYALALILNILNKRPEILYSQLLEKVISDISHERVTAVIKSLEKMHKIETKIFYDNDTQRDDIEIKFLP